MAEKGKSGMLLGKQVPAARHYAPELLFPIPRDAARRALGVNCDNLPFRGCDLWHAYELSWLQGEQVPVSRVGRLMVPAESPCMVESKSLKLYLNSLNNHCFADEAEAISVIEKDVSDVVGAEVTLELFDPDSDALAGAGLSGECLDKLEVSPPGSEPSAKILRVAVGKTVKKSYYSHLLRSLCPVTGQPDWATLWVSYQGAAVEPGSLLSYILAYRQHQEFHEQCVERIFMDLTTALAPVELHVQACYTRRGGLDINPFRSTTPSAKPLARLNRQ